MAGIALNDPNNEDRKTFFVDVIVPLPIPRMFTYRSPQDLNPFLQTGSRVIVPFGSRKIVTGIIGRIHETPPVKYEAKYLLDVLDQEPAVNTLQIDLFQWIAGYYMCSPGEVMNVALPSGLKPSSESRLQLHPHFDSTVSPYDYSPREKQLIALLENNGARSYSEACKALQLKTIFPLIKSLVQKEAIILFESIAEKYKPKKESRVRLSESYSQAEALKTLFAAIEKRPKQEALLLEYLHRIPVKHLPAKNSQGVKKKTLQQPGFSKTSLETLIKKGIFEQFEVIVPRFPDDDMETTPVTLTEIQQTAEEEIITHFEQTNTVLLHGITGSGKTEVYISLIEKVLQSGSQVLYLLPEIALTIQIVNRLRKALGNIVGIYHSKFSDNERVEIWNGILSGRYRVVLGVRSSVFLPFDNLGLIIVDEEHESSYKQYDPAPRYNAKDVALYLAGKHGAKVLLGSATPSLESYYQALEGKYRLVTLHQRYGTAQLPDFVVTDMIKEAKSKTLKGEFSSVLVDRIRQVLAKGEQAIIFQNRRGYSPYISCEQCAHIPKCINCAVTLTYHQYKKQLICHYCGYQEPLPGECDACGAKDLKTIGVGTEKLEEELAMLFPAAKVHRLDLEVARSKNSYERIIHDFEKKEIDLLVGTRMITKGLDFDHVSLVGVFDLDRMLHFPDFRAHERTFQLTTQVSGRAGRRDKTGTVIIQARDTKSDVLRDITQNNYAGFYAREIAERNQHRYPPFTRLISIVIKNANAQVAEKAADRLANIIREQLGSHRVLGPQEPLISKIRNEYLVELLIKLERKKIDLQKAKYILQTSGHEIMAEKSLKKTRIVFNVDPF